MSLSVLKRIDYSSCSNFSNLKEAELAFVFQTDIVYYNPQMNNWTEYSIQLMQRDEEVRQMFLKFLQELGTGTKDVKVKLESKKYNHQTCHQRFLIL